jgi:DNA-binding NtrC family response regulator
MSRSRAVREAYAQACVIARTNWPIFLLGESGVGKTEMARQIHQWSPRHDGPFGSVNLGASDEGLAGSQLFGHVQGAFTGANKARPGALVASHRGTLFCDELAKAPRGIQLKLLPMLDGQPTPHVGSDCPIRVDVRFIFAANEPLVAMVENGGLAEELYGRLCSWTITIPALRNRRADIPDLIRTYIAASASKSGYGGLPLPTVDKRLESFLVDCRWPYNLRQLHHAVARILTNAQGARELRLEHIPDELYELLIQPRAAIDRKPTPEERDALIADALRRSGGNKAEAARISGKSESSIRRFCKKDEEASRDDTIADLEGRVRASGGRAD